jgi:ornithine cyclodeaminase/alanine dehydrogenase-like protein (mu-crystallin family)
MIELLRRSTGEPLAVMDGRLITEMRTAAVSAVALDALAPTGASLGILGSGVQARSHIQAFGWCARAQATFASGAARPPTPQRLADETGAAP